jgi:hypothetical protein
MPSQTVRAVPATGLVAELFFERELSSKRFGREQPFEQVVVPAVPVAARETEHSRYGICLEHGADDVGRRPEPVGRASALTLEVER